MARKGAVSGNIPMLFMILLSFSLGWQAYSGSNAFADEVIEGMSDLSHLSNAQTSNDIFFYQFVQTAAPMAVQQASEDLGKNSGGMDWNAETLIREVHMLSLTDKHLQTSDGILESKYTGDAFETTPCDIENYKLGLKLPEWYQSMNRLDIQGSVRNTGGLMTTDCEFNDKSSVKFNSVEGFLDSEFTAYSNRYHQEAWVQIQLHRNLRQELEDINTTVIETRWGQCGGSRPTDQEVRETLVAVAENRVEDAIDRSRQDIPSYDGIVLENQDVEINLKNFQIVDDSLQEVCAQEYHDSDCDGVCQTNDCDDSDSSIGDWHECSDGTCVPEPNLCQINPSTTSSQDPKYEDFRDSSTVRASSSQSKTCTLGETCRTMTPDRQSRTLKTHGSSFNSFSCGSGSYSNEYSYGGSCPSRDVYKLGKRGRADFELEQTEITYQDEDNKILTGSGWQHLNFTVEWEQELGESQAECLDSDNDGICNIHDRNIEPPYYPVDIFWEEDSFNTGGYSGQKNFNWNFKNMQFDNGDIVADIGNVLKSGNKDYSSHPASEFFVRDSNLETWRSVSGSGATVPADAEVMSISCKPDGFKELSVGKCRIVNKDNGDVLIEQNNARYAANRNLNGTVDVSDKGSFDIGTEYYADGGSDGIYESDVRFNVDYSYRTSSNPRAWAVIKPEIMSSHKQNIKWGNAGFRGQNLDGIEVNIHGGNGQRIISDIENNGAIGYTGSEDIYFNITADIMADQSRIEYLNLTAFYDGPLTGQNLDIFYPYNITSDLNNGDTVEDFSENNFFSYMREGTLSPRGGVEGTGGANYHALDTPGYSTTEFNPPSNRVSEMAISFWAREPNRASGVFMDLPNEDGHVEFFHAYPDTMMMLGWWSDEYNPRVIIDPNAPDWSPNQWNHVVINFERGKWWVYTNGNRIAGPRQWEFDTGINNNQIDFGGAANITFGSTSSYRDSGLPIDEFRLYFSTLSETQIMDLYENKSVETGNDVYILRKEEQEQSSDDGTFTTSYDALSEDR